jgi:prepilin-type N-terminal cleavage/methylation domain-containing protein
MTVARPCSPPRALTLIELLVVVAIIAILASIAVVNFQHAQERALRAANVANLRVVGQALQAYMTDWNRLPAADRRAGPFESHRRTDVAVGNGPAAGGSWDGVPWLLVSRGYITNPNVLFNPRYLRLYRGGTTLDGSHPRYHNFRYAYNNSAWSTGGTLGAASDVMSGREWLVRDLYLPADRGWYADRAPEPPADYEFPFGEGEWAGKLEHALYADFTVRLVLGGTDKAPGETPEDPS